MIKFSLSVLRKMPGVEVLGCPLLSTLRIYNLGEVDISKTKVVFSGMFCLPQDHQTVFVLEGVGQGRPMFKGEICCQFQGRGNKQKVIYSH